MGSTAADISLSVLEKMIASAESLLGTKDLYWLDGSKVSPPQAGAVLTCGFCGREFDTDWEQLTDCMLCPADDCAANSARKLIKEQRATIRARVQEVKDLAGAPCTNCQSGTYASMSPDFYAVRCLSCGWSATPKEVRAVYKRAQSFYKRIREYKDNKGDHGDTTSTTQSGDERDAVP